MNFRDFTNPRKVYDGYFETYFIRPFFHHYADFGGRESGYACLCSLAAWLIVSLGVVGILMGQVGLLGPEVGFTLLLVVGCVWGAFSLVPIAALVVRASHGAPDNERKPKFLGVDTLLFASSILFFVLGLMMMITTLNSGLLDPNAGATDEPDTTTLQLEEVTEEPIFTYQDATPAVEDTTDDALSDMTEPDLVTSEESFDPTIAGQDDELLDESPKAINDSI